MRLMVERLHKDHIIAAPGFNRWLVPLASIAIHLCIGSIYAWSLFNPALTKTLGVVVPAAGDWSLTEVVWIFSVAIACLGLAAAFAGRWLEEVGPRLVGVVAAACWGGGFLIAGIGILTHQLGLLYVGYGVIGGCGLGLGYVSPVSTLIRWFPDRRGMATGMAIMGFGGGAMLGTPLIEGLLSAFAVTPEYLGRADALNLMTSEGIRYVEISAGVLREVVLLGPREAAQLNLVAGAYAVGTGSTGAAATFFTLGLVYFSIMIIAAFSYRVPAADWQPAGWQEPTAPDSMVTRRDVHIDQALKTPQFYLLWVVLCCNVTAGIGVLGVAKTMLSEIFSTLFPSIVTVAFAANYVLMISLFNMLGRLFWASLSDVIGRKTTYTVFSVLGILLYLGAPYSAIAANLRPDVVWLILFYVATLIIFTMYGGGFATIPAYLADIFGTRYVGGIHGRLLTAWSVAGVAGPVVITQLRESSRQSALESLAAHIPESAFVQAFGAGKASLADLIDTRTVTIQSLLEIAPPGILDPSATLYNTTMYAMAALLAVALMANLLVRPVHASHYLPATSTPAE